MLPLTHTVTPGSQLGLAEDGQDREEGSSHLSWAAQSERAAFWGSQSKLPRGELLRLTCLTWKRLSGRW